MTSKALKAALLTSLLTGSDANPFSRRRTPSSEHNEKVSKKQREFLEQTMRGRVINQNKRNLKKQQKLAQQSFRHIDDMDGKKRMLKFLPSICTYIAIIPLSLTYVPQCSGLY